MSEENVEIVQAVYDAYDRGDFEAAFEHLHEEIEWSDPPGHPGGDTRHGHEGVRQSLSNWLGAWDDYSYEFDELIDLGDHVLAAGWQRGRGKGSGVDVSEAIFHVWTLRAGKVVRQRMFRDRGQALEAAVLEE